MCGSVSGIGSVEGEEPFVPCEPRTYWFGFCDWVAIA